MSFFSRTILVVFFAFMQNMASAQDSSRLRISLLTCTPGEELYSTFGHSALRVIDSNSVSDMVFNYGTFNFEEKGFYVKFIRGKLLYCLSWSSFEDFKAEYVFENRGITEQVLDLSGEEKLRVMAAIRENAKEENRYYKYDFFLDNCTTRLRDLIVKNKSPKPQLPAVMPEKFRFRQAIHQYLDQNHKDWSKLGIDILLGAPCDAVMTTAQQQFLPDNLMIALDSTKNTRMVLSSQNVLPVENNFFSALGKSMSKLKFNLFEFTWFTPMVCFSILLLLFMALSLIHKKVRVLLNVLDGLLFFTTGALGILLLFMWFGTDHSMTKTNYNLLWAFPMHIIIAFCMNSKKKLVKKYFLFTTLGMTLVLISWSFLPQQMNNALLPVAILVLFRAFARYRKMQAGV
ncbi:DUF4105 domain-containing protein [Ferruginibacter sp. HRS2-29]|uniref:lipoprotein N-acyltransferase Lnb domain-containing protein n=1 Tax=Ferruginibacter sp. HRS2-29 TaxID=2487334 RepID=UPI0020CF84D4|nr:DUF4105 domain-containing protein [Ferruginibacter sp. HRS2-29]MCP9753299.1 DUF4105 domain-containing protein [Ferruginibacter sp. HRS2-29]